VRRHCPHHRTFDSQDVSYLHDQLHLREKSTQAIIVPMIRVPILPPR
jgi:hypothetical protein